MTQTEARTEARALQAQGIPAVAGTVPLTAWGGHEREWTVYIGAPYGS
jgi:hypothetical protein